MLIVAGEWPGDNKVRRADRALVGAPWDQDNKVRRADRTLVDALWHQSHVAVMQSMAVEAWLDMPLGALAEGSGSWVMLSCSLSSS